MGGGTDEREYEADSEIGTGAVDVSFPADKGISANPSLPPICGGDANWIFGVCFMSGELPVVFLGNFSGDRFCGLVRDEAGIDRNVDPGEV